ncbi:MAG TPA: acyl-CoA dehydrogenase family protein [Mycobacterium sp.]
MRADISAVKAAMPAVLRNIALRAMHLHGSLGVSDELPLGHFLIEAEWLSLADGPTEVHEKVLADSVLATYEPAPDVFPSAHIPRLREQAAAKYRSRR